METLRESAPPLSPMDKRYGPRVFVKRDSESSINRGAVLFGVHFRPRLSVIIMHVCAIVNDLDCGDAVWITEGYRHIRETRDCHQTLDAFDITISKAGKKISEEQYADVAKRLSFRLGPGYDVIAHGVGAGHHIHAEWDPKDGEEERAYVAAV